MARAGIRVANHRFIGSMALGLCNPHRRAAASLPDPFDRLLVAQAQLERMPIVSADRVLRAYDVEVIAR